MKVTNFDERLFFTKQASHTPSFLHQFTDDAWYELHDVSITRFHLVRLMRELLKGSAAGAKLLLRFRRESTHRDKVRDSYGMGDGHSIEVLLQRADAVVRAEYAVHIVAQIEMLRKVFGVDVVHAFPRGLHEVEMRREI